MTDIQPGTTVYNRAGHKARYLSSTADGHAVKPAVTFYDGDGEERQDYDGIALWHECFLKPPTEVLHEEVAQLNAQIEAAQAALEELRLKRREEDKGIEERKARLKQHELLARLDDYVAGKITHYLILESYENIPRIITLDQTKGDDYDKRYRLLTLHAKTSWGGKLEWSLSQYYDGSGMADKVIPCRSQEEAVAEGTKIFEANLAKWRKPEERRFVSIRWLLCGAKNLGLTVPEDVLAANRADTLQQATKTAEDARASLAKAETALAALQS